MVFAHVGQVRDDHTVPSSAAWQQFWPHTLLGVGCVGLLALTHPSAIPYALLIAGGPLLAVPLAAAIAVLFLFAMRQYLASPLYTVEKPP